jgi:hypothetical protein
MDTNEEILHNKRAILFKEMFHNKYQHCIDQYNMHKDMNDLDMMENTKDMADVYKRALSGAMTNDKGILNKLCDQYTNEQKRWKEYQMDKYIQEVHNSNCYMFPGFHDMDDSKPYGYRNISHPTRVTPIEDLYHLLKVSEEDHKDIINKLVFETMEFQIINKQIYTNFKTIGMIMVSIPDAIVSKKDKDLIQVWLNYVPNVYHLTQNL